MAIRAANVLTWDGSKPLHSNVSAHSAEELSFVEFTDLVTDGARRIRKRRGRVAIGTQAMGAITALHEFEYLSGGVLTYKVFRTYANAIERWTGAAWVAETLPYTPTSGVQWVFRNFAQKCFAVNGDTDATKGQMIYYDGTNWRVVGITDPVTPATYSLAGIYNTGSVETFLLPTPKRIKGSIGAIWNAATDDGKFIDINGIRYTIGAVVVPGDGIGIRPEADLTENFKETLSAGLPYRIYRGVMAWINPPRYSWAWRNPTTQHVSNRAPATEITERDRVGTTPTITIPGSSANTDAYNAGYTQIVIFRTYAEGNRLISIDDSVVTVNNNALGNPISFTETATTMLDRSLSGLIAPFQTNTKPPVGVTALELWIGRLFLLWLGNSTNTPRIMFSAVQGEVSMGRPEECYPVLFARSSIPQPTGMVRVGADGLRNSLIVQATDGDYSLQGYDNMTLTDPYQLGTRASGGFLFGAINVDGRLVQLYRDRRLLDSESGDIGFKVQDKLKTITAAHVTKARLFRFTYDDTNAFFVSAPFTGTTNNRTLMFDLDLGRINDWSFGCSAATTVHNAGALELWVGNSSGNVYALQREGVFQDAGVSYTPTFTTNTLDFGERPRLLSQAELFIGPSAVTTTGWVLTLFVDEEPVGVDYEFYVNPEPNQNAQGLQLIYRFDKPIRLHRVKAQLTYPTTATDAYVEQLSLGFDEEASTAGAQT